MRQILRVLLAAAVFYAAAAVVTARPANSALYPPRADEPAVTVYVAADAVHSNLLLPTALLAARPGPLADAVATLKPGPWTAVGWGDQAFYQGSGWSAARLPDLLRALFKPANPPVILLAETAAPTADPTHPEVLRLMLSRRGFEALAERLDASLRLEADRPVPIGAGAEARFFKANGAFSILHACNPWTAEMLHAAGAPITPLLDLPSAGLERDLTWRAHAVRLSMGAT